MPQVSHDNHTLPASVTICRGASGAVFTLPCMLQLCCVCTRCPVREATVILKGDSHRRIVGKLCPAEATLLHILFGTKIVLLPIFVLPSVSNVPFKLSSFVVCLVSPYSMPLTDCYVHAQ